MPPLHAAVKSVLILPARATVSINTQLATRLRSQANALLRAQVFESQLNTEILHKQSSSRLLGPLSLVAQKLSEKEETERTDGVDTYECRWGRKWFGNYRNLPRNTHTPFGNKKRLWKFRVKKQQFKHRQKKKRMKIAAIGNTPFNKKIRVQMTSRFEHLGRRRCERGCQGD